MKSFVRCHADFGLPVADRLLSQWRFPHSNSRSLRHATVRRNHGGELCHRRVEAGDRARRALRCEGTGHRRKRRRQGARRARHSRAQPAGEPAVRSRQLRRPSGNTAGVRAVRPREGQLHRRLSRQAGQARDRSRRHDLPRRSRRDVAAHAGPAAAVPRDGRAAEGRERTGRHAGQRARGRRDQQAPVRHDRPGHVPRGSVLPAERHPSARSAAAAAQAGHPGHGRSLPPAVPARQSLGGRIDRARCARGADGLFVAGERARAPERPRAAGRRRARLGRAAGRSARGAARQPAGAPRRPSPWPPPSTSSTISTAG